MENYQNQNYNYNYSNGEAAPRARTRDEFFQTDGSEFAKSCRTSSIICFICAGITLVVMVFIVHNWLSIIDVGLLIGLGLGIHLKQNFPCAVILLVYAIINSLINIITTGNFFGGVLVLLAGIFGVINTSKAQSAWTEYQYRTEQINNNRQLYQQNDNQYNSDVQQEYVEDRMPEADEWKCPTCGKCNKNYVGTCGCGTNKPR